MAVIGRLKRLAQLVDAELRRTFSVHGLDAASFDVLATLRRSAPPHRLTPAQLMRSAMVTSGAITQRLDRLQEAALVTRDRSASDGRVVEVALTPAGRDLIDRVLPDHLAAEHRLLAALGDGERAPSSRRCAHCSNRWATARADPRTGGAPARSPRRGMAAGTAHRMLVSRTAATAVRA
ncbi:MarR family winged helix-turn-helix transcriptional regulator [Pseudonocardia sp. GCM10023141]|uniref:MarR family winged helix-turn-helix transcriptional regulator n=1 Tax=Pseudonocardia sp. GCM10023141 TaxID=3252653 RepID=UPI00362329CF